MKKLIYSALSFALIATTLFFGCKKDDGTDPVVPVEKGPNISFQTNAGSGSGVFTFADGKVITGEQIKMGIRITSDVNLKSSKMTVNFNSVGEVVLHDTTYTSNTKTSNRDVSYIFPTVKGPYVFTIYAEDKDGNKKSAKITIVAAGPLLDRDDGQFWSIKAIGATKLSAFNLFDGEAITASASATNQANRDIVDASTGATLSKTWNSDPANGTEFIISGNDNKLNGKVYSQFNSEQDVLDAWNALSSTKSISISNVDLGKLIIAKSKRGTEFFYYLIAITNINDAAGSEDDYYEFQYKQ